MPTEKKDVKKYARVSFLPPLNVNEAIDKVVELGIYPSKNQFLLDASIQQLRLTVITLSVWIDVKKKAKNPIERYTLFAKALQNRLTLEAMDSWIKLSNRVGVALDKYPISTVEKFVKELEDLIEENKEMDLESVVSNANGTSQPPDKAGGNP